MRKVPDELAPGEAKADREAVQILRKMGVPDRFLTTPGDQLTAQDWKEAFPSLFALGEKAKKLRDHMSKDHSRGEEAKLRKQYSVWKRAYLSSTYETASYYDLERLHVLLHVPSTFRSEAEKGNRIQALVLVPKDQLLHVEEYHYKQPPGDNPPVGALGHERYNCEYCGEGIVQGTEYTVDNKLACPRCYSSLRAKRRTELENAGEPVI